EKPFGLDLKSSRELDATLREVAEEDQVFRIDHFLGKEAVQNILALRFANGVVEPAWGRHTVEQVQIDVPEDLGIEGRGGFYESTGCLRDMVSTHLLQLLGHVALEDPGSADEEAIRDARAAAYDDLRPLDPKRVVRGQYAGYRDEDGVADDSDVETFVALEAFVDDDRWRGVPFYLRTGKALAATHRQITVRFREPESQMFADADFPCRNELVLDLADEPVIELRLRGQRPGPELTLATATMRLDIAEELPEADGLEAYERLLLDVLRGDHTLFARGDEVDRLWRACQPVLDAPPPLHTYERGSWGPEEALALPDGGWRLG